MTYVPPPLVPRLKSRIRRRLVNLRHRLRLRRDEMEIFDHCRFFGADFIVRLDDHIGYEMAIGIFEWVQLDALIKACERIQPDAFLDIGVAVDHVGEAGLHQFEVQAARRALRVPALA